MTLCSITLKNIWFTDILQQLCSFRFTVAVSANTTLRVWTVSAAGISTTTCRGDRQRWRTLTPAEVRTYGRTHCFLHKHTWTHEFLDTWGVLCVFLCFLQVIATESERILLPQQLQQDLHHALLSFSVNNRLLVSYIFSMNTEVPLESWESRVTQTVHSQLLPSGGSPQSPNTLAYACIIHSHAKIKYYMHFILIIFFYWNINCLRWLFVRMSCTKRRMSSDVLALTMWYVCLQSVTATATQTSVTLTWLYIWLWATLVGAYVTSVCTTPWDATARCVNRSTIVTWTGTSGTHVCVLVSLANTILSWYTAEHMIYCYCVLLLHDQ